jgi:16S rRNA (adenine1518-N6/adenine1519-N6)-dimethyltransferase
VIISRAELIEQGLAARKSLGQHFLLDPGITARIARLAGDIAGRTVIEVGPGPGGLTHALLAAGAAKVIALEKDERFAAFLRTWPEAEDGRLIVHEVDALEADEPSLLEPGAAPAPIIANLPYNVGTPLLVKWLKAGAWRGPMTLMFQLEVARRIVAAPGDAAYGRLAVLTAARCNAHVAMKLGAGAFSPPPKVDSAVVTLEDRKAPYPDLDALERVTEAAFGQRRKMLRGSLKSLGDVEALLSAAGLRPEARAEEIEPAGFFALADAWRASTDARQRSAQDV